MKSDLDSGKELSSKDSPSSLKGCPKDGVVESTSWKDRPKGGVVDYFMVNGTPVYKRYTPNLPYNPNLKLRAREFRKAGVLSEVLFWQVVHQGHFCGIDFDRQRVIGNYIVDFYVKSLSLVVEIDGASHEGKEENDKERQIFLESLGLLVFRIEDYRVKIDLDAIMRELENYIIKEYSTFRPTAT
jgi:very-short-patch-repair endonuclease